MDIVGDLHVRGGDIRHVGNDLTLNSTNGKVIVEGLEINDRDILTDKDVSKFEHTGNTSFTMSSSAQLHLQSVGKSTMTSSVEIQCTAPTIRANDIAIDNSENVSNVNTLTAKTLRTDSAEDFSTSAGSTTTKRLSVTDALIDVSSKPTLLQIKAAESSSLTIGKSVAEPLLVLDTTAAAPSASLSGDMHVSGGNIHLTGDIVGTSNDLAVSATKNVAITALGGSVTVENVVIDGDDTTTPEDLILTKPTASITHTGATSLNISTSQANAKVHVEDTEFHGSNITNTGTTTSTNIQDGTQLLSFRTSGGHATTRTVQVGKSSAAKTAVLEVQPDAQISDQTHALLVNGASAISEFKGHLRVSGGLLDVSATDTELRLVSEHATGLTIKKSGGTGPLFTLNTTQAAPSASLWGDFHVGGHVNISAGGHVRKGSGDLEIEAERVRVKGIFDLTHTKRFGSPKTTQARF